MFYLEPTLYVYSLSFFFSSRRRHTRCLSDWSSDVCSSDLQHASVAVLVVEDAAQDLGADDEHVLLHARLDETGGDLRAEHEARTRRRDVERSEERRVGKECSSKWAAHQEKTNITINRQVRK